MLGTVARLGACAYLVYIIIKLLKSTDKTPLMIGISIVLLAAAVIVIVLTLVEFVRGIKNGMYKESTYYTDEYLEKVKREQEEYRREHPEEFEDEEPGDEAEYAPDDEDGEEPPELPEAGEDTDEADE